MAWIPHVPIPVEPSFDEFIRRAGGERVDEFIEKNPTHDNADYVFACQPVVAELKEIQTEFSRAEGVIKRQLKAIRDARQKEEISFGDIVRGGPFPQGLQRTLLRAYRPPIQRILKKANNQIKETKKALALPEAQGLLFLVNDEFKSVSPNLVHALACESLAHSYKAIDGLVYLTVNTYVGLPNDEYARLIWTTAYGDNATDKLVKFVDDLGRLWFTYLEEKIGPFDIGRDEGPDRSRLRGSVAIRHPMK